MSQVREFIESGILELYVLGNVSPEEEIEVERMAAVYEEVKAEIESISVGFENYALMHAVEPNPTIKPFLMATINYTERLQNGEALSFPPMLNEGSKKEDFDQWLNRSDLQLTPDFEDFYARIIGYTPEAVTAIAWLKYGSPFEIHDREIEKFLILEGTCDIAVGDVVYPLKTGNYMAIPLYLGHDVKVTSQIPCKVILQRTTVL